MGIKRDNVLRFLIAALLTSVLLFETGNSGLTQAAFERTSTTDVGGTQRVEIANETRVPSLAVPFIDENPFNSSGWSVSDHDRDGHFDTLFRSVYYSVLNLTDLTVELQFRARKAPLSVQIVFEGSNTSTTTQTDEVQILVLHLSFKTPFIWNPDRWNEFSDWGIVELHTSGDIFTDVDLISLKLVAVSAIPLVPVSFVLMRSNNESLSASQPVWYDHEFRSIGITPRNVTALSSLNANQSLFGDFEPWRRTDEILLPPGTYS
jgi:hypothetical protein